MSKEIIANGYKYEPLPNSLYIFKSDTVLTQQERDSIIKTFDAVANKGERFVLLENGVDYMPPDNEALANRLDNIEASIQELISLVDGRTK